MTNANVTRKTILVVEDSPTQALRLQSLLEDRDLHVELAANGRVGLHRARQLRPDLVILDLEMPEMNGVEVCEALKTAPDTADIPIIMFTSREDEEVVLYTLGLGIVDFIPKDVFADAVLLETMRQMGLLDNGDGSG